jgi:4-amino-4-deoxy-L-arabinose transferase-like glycosyltransferase
MKQLEQLIYSAAHPLRPVAPILLGIGIVVVLLAIAWLVILDSRNKASVLAGNAGTLTEKPAAVGYWLIPLLLFIAVGAVLRLVGLGDTSLNHTEVYIPGIPLPEGISEPPPRLDWFSALTWGFFKEPHPVAYYLAMFGWTNLFGTSVAALRMPTALIGILSIPVIYRVGKLAYEWKTGLIAAGFLALHGFHIHTSKWARMFVPQCFLGLVLTWLLLEIFRARRNRGLLEALYVLVALIGFHTEWFFWPLIGTHFVFALIHFRKDGQTRRLVYLQVFAMILGAVTLTEVAATAGLAASGSRASFETFREYFSFGIFYHPGFSELYYRPWPMPLILVSFAVSIGLLWRGLGIKPVATDESVTVGQLPIRPMLLAAAGMTLVMASIVPLATTLIAKAKYMPLIVAVVAFPAAAIVAFAVATRFGPVLQSWLESQERRRPILRILTSPIVLLALLPFLMVCVGAFARPMIDRQALLMFVPYVLILIAAGAREFARRRVVAIPLTVVLILLFAGSVRHFEAMPQSHRDYASLGREINSRMTGSDVVFILPLKWYVTPLFYYVDASRLVAANYEKHSVKPHARVWVVLFANEQPAPEISAAVAGLTLSDTVDVSGARGLLYERR